jgi:hypothetical protein
MQIARRAADEFLLLLRSKENRQRPQHSQEQRHGLLGHLIGQHARGARDDDF